MARDKNPNQIIRFDGNNVFCEVMNTAFGIDKVLINFIEYDTSKEKNNRITKNIPIYIDLDKFTVLIQDILSGRMNALAKQEKDRASKAGSKYCQPIYVDMGGVSARVLKERGKERPDGMSISRQFKITPGDRKPWILSAEIGAGEENDKGLIVPRGKAEEIVRVPLVDEDLKKLALMVDKHIQGYVTAQYMAKILNPSE